MAARLLAHQPPHCLLQPTGWTGVWCCSLVTCLLSRCGLERFWTFSSWWIPRKEPWEVSRLSADGPSILVRTSTVLNRDCCHEEPACSLRSWPLGRSCQDQRACHRFTCECPYITSKTSLLADMNTKISLQIPSPVCAPPSPYCLATVRHPDTWLVSR